MDLNECYAFYGSAMNKLVHVILYDVLSKEFELFLGMMHFPDFQNRSYIHQSRENDETRSKICCLSVPATF